MEKYEQMKANASKKRHAHTATLKAMVINTFEESEMFAKTILLSSFELIKVWCSVGLKIDIQS